MCWVVLSRMKTQLRAFSDESSRAVRRLGVELKKLTGKKDSSMIRVYFI